MNPATFSILCQISKKRLQSRFFSKNAVTLSSAISQRQTGITSFYTTNRSFSTSTIAYKKGGKAKGKAKNNVEPEAEEEEFDSVGFLRDVEKKYKDSIEVYKKKSSESKSGKTNTKIFDNLSIPLAHNQSAKFTDVAQTTLKGRNLLITLFDPNDSKHVVSAVLGAGLNLNPQVDQKNPQLLKVPLPAPTAEVKIEAVKNLKSVFETFKSSSSKFAFTSIRSDALKELKKLKGGDEVKKIMKNVEDLNKQYNKKLADQFKDLEKSMMQ
ncbi:Rrf1 protein [Saccharomycopsis crataegensis]|uniref:Ribosome-recycling factor, mitochondrial n=1 Tax=Saccharomycopsis crataegensis TaxID=43959 RepID=A0AAV5QN24_9ASCO|nr:Rrf1 protein [Saccharomycopsis crataegensis]